MPEPLTVSIPHRHGKAEAARRLKAGLEKTRAQFSHLITIEEETWSGDTMIFRVRALGQSASGDIAVQDDKVVLTVTLPWLLAKFSGAVRRRIDVVGALLLEKK